jgi:predicted Holliday junction resolvase-like endonuclease
MKIVIIILIIILFLFIGSILTEKDRTELILIELKQEELTLAYKKDKLESIVNNANVPECSIREAKYEYELQKLKVEFKKAELKIKR